MRATGQLTGEKNCNCRIKQNDLNSLEILILALDLKAKG